MEGTPNTLLPQIIFPVWQRSLDRVTLFQGHPENKWQSWDLGPTESRIVYCCWVTPRPTALTVSPSMPAPSLTGWLQCSNWLPPPHDPLAFLVPQGAPTLRRPLTATPALVPSPPSSPLYIPVSTKHHPLGGVSPVSMKKPMRRWKGSCGCCLAQLTEEEQGLGWNEPRRWWERQESPARVQRDWAALLTLHAFPLNVHNYSSQMPLS